MTGCSQGDAPARTSAAAIKKTSDVNAKKIFAPLFKLKTIAGAEISLNALRGKTVIVNLWASWCGPCRQETPALERLYKNFKGKGVEFVGVAVDENLMNVNNFVREFGVTYPMGLDDTGTISRDYGANFIPMTIVVAPDGSVSFVYNGMI
ncbi:MAG: TlpA family protein disulfide reductase, partial [Nitrospirota bacterium]|nr:TlpA family protein disulfide reductase [Nitrospirota bacterium]